MSEDKLKEYLKNTETGCCPKFNPDEWEGKEVVWDNKLFTKDTVSSLFYIPINFGKVIARDMKKIAEKDAFSSDLLILSDPYSKWKSDLYISVKEDISGLEMVRLSGTFLTKVFEGPYKDMKKWMKEMESFIEAKGKKIQKMYFFYTTCPKCAKYYGKNYTVIFAKV